MILNNKDYNRLINSIKQLRITALSNPNVKKLAEGIKKAKVIDDKETPEDLVTMNSKVVIKRLDNKQEMEISVVYHDDSDVKNKKISVFSPIGMTLLGGKVKEVFLCELPNGKAQYEICKLTYQPEAAGDFQL